MALLRIDCGNSGDKLSDYEGALESKKGKATKKQLLAWRGTQGRHWKKLYSKFQKLLGMVMWMLCMDSMDSGLYDWILAGFA